MLLNMDSTPAVHVYLAEQTVESSDQTQHLNTLLNLNNIPAVHVYLAEHSVESSDQTLHSEHSA